MNAALLINEEHELDFPTSLVRSESPRGRELSSRDRLSARARYRRSGKSASSFNGPHRRRQKRNYL